MTSQDNQAPFAPKGEAPSLAALQEERDELRVKLLESHESIASAAAVVSGMGAKLEMARATLAMLGNRSRAWDLPYPEIAAICERTALALDDAKAALSAPPPPEVQRLRAALLEAHEYAYSVDQEAGEELCGDCADCEAAKHPAPPPPEPVVRWCLKDENGVLQLSALAELPEYAWNAHNATPRMLMARGCTVVRVEITERPE